MLRPHRHRRARDRALHLRPSPVDKGCMAKAAIELTGVRASYGKFVALDDLSFSVRPGEVFGLLGPNGAGKSTTVDICCGLRRPDAGTAKVLGLDVTSATRKVRARIGVVPQDS